MILPAVDALRRLVLAGEADRLAGLAVVSRPVVSGGGADAADSGLVTGPREVAELPAPGALDDLLVGGFVGLDRVARAVDDDGLAGQAIFLRFGGKEDDEEVGAKGGLQRQGEPVDEPT